MRGKLSGILPLGAALICLGALFLSFGCGSSNARFRFVQASTAVPTNVDLQIDGKSIQTNIGFGQTATYRSISSGSHKFELFATGTTTNPYLSATASVSGDTTVIAEGPFTSIGLAPYTDTNTTPTTGNVSVRFINASPTIGVPPNIGVDIYVVQSGNGIGGQNPSITNLVYPNTPANPYLSLAAGTYDIFVTVNGTQNVLTDLTNIVVTSGQVRTFVILDSSVGGGPYGLLELNDLN